MKKNHSIQLIGVLLLTGSLSQNLEAQRVRSVAFHANAQPDSSTARSAGKVSYRIVGDTAQSRASGTANTALIGAGIGGATGIVAAFILTHQASVHDHSEDALAYVGLAAFGALIGLIVGGVVGFNRN